MRVLLYDPQAATIERGADALLERWRWNPDSLAELHYGLASDLADPYLGLSAHRLNQVMMVLTVITVIFVPSSFLAGIYSMNFENMPELHSRFGYYVLLGIMGCVVAIQAQLFRRKKWL